MKTATVIVRALDTLMFRDGRPFTTDPGSRADTLLVPTPQTLAGFMRTRLGRSVGCRDREAWERVSADTRVRGPLLCRNEAVILPCPADAVVPKREDDDPGGAVIEALRPWSRSALQSLGAGADLPGGMLPLKVTSDAKPSSEYPYWSWQNAMRWLADKPLAAEDLTPKLAPPIDERVHIAVDPATETAAEGMLFSTRMVASEWYRWAPDEGHTMSRAEYSYLCRVECMGDPGPLRGPAALGGESRVAVTDEVAPETWPTCPADLAGELRTAAKVRLLLATPAIFTRGWMPGWLDNTTKTGSPPGILGVTLKLVAAAVPRRQAVSGWDLANTPGRPKPVRYCAPAGSVYFFEVTDGDPARLASEGWLAPVSDDEMTREPGHCRQNNRDDGFGLALWGVWGEKE